MIIILKLNKTWVDHELIHLRMLPGLGGEGAFAAVEIEKPDVVRFHGASEVLIFNEFIST